MQDMVAVASLPRLRRLETWEKAASFMAPVFGARVIRRESPIVTFVWIWESACDKFPTAYTAPQIYLLGESFLKSLWL
jgi:hypothetical protein